MAKSGNENGESVSSAQFGSEDQDDGDDVRAQIPFPEWSDQEVNAEKWEMPKVLQSHFLKLITCNMFQTTSAVLYDYFVQTAKYYI